jgi:signal transduction histidine kinase
MWAVLSLAIYLGQPLPDDGAVVTATRLAYHVVHLGMLAALSATIVWVARATESWRLGSRLGLHLVLATAFAGLVSLIAAIAVRGGIDTSAVPIERATYETHFLAYFVILALAHGVDFIAWRRDQRVEEARLAERAAKLEAQLARTELRILRSQLDPHFLFNTLHVISELVHVDPRRADRMVARLGDLLRMSASLARAPDVALRDELAFVNAYLEIQEARFGARLRVVRDVDAATLDAAVPSLLVQPLVENAIRHGTSRRASGGQVDIIARRDGSTLVIEVQDNGPGVTADVTPNEGIGIGHTRARLAQLYGSASRLELEARPSGGTTARVRLPFTPAGARVAADTAAAEW